MKKIILLFFTFFLSITSYSQLALEGFEGTFPPTNWSVFDTGVGAVNWSTNATACAGSTAAYMNRQVLNQGSVFEDYLSTPAFTVPINGQLKFCARSFTSGLQGTIYEVKVAAAVSAQNDPASYVTIQTYNENQLSAVFNVYEDKTIDLTAFVGTQIYVAFVMKFTQPGTALAGDRWLLDNVQVVEQCLVPTDQAAAPLATSASLSWLGSGNGFEIENLVGTTPPTGIATGTSATNTFNQTGLTPNTNYCYYVRAVCSEGNNSPWAGPFCYTTTTLPPVCGGNFVDSGGANGNYSNNENTTVTILPINAGDQVTVNFTNFNTQIDTDILTVYEGSVIAPEFIIGTYSGTANPGSITSAAANGALTFVFVSNGTTTQAGWNSTVTCGPAPACAKPIALVSSAVLATSATLTWTQPQNPDGSTATAWQVIALPCGSATPTDASAWLPATGNPHNFTGLLSNTCYDLYVRAICSETLTSTPAGPGSITTTTLPPVCGGNFTDSGGPDGPYQNNEEIITTITSDSPLNIVTVSFTSFNTEGCCDDLMVYDGIGTGGTLLGTYAGTALPPDIVSSLGGSLTFVFTSDGSVTPAGWIANITCAPPPQCPKPTTLVASAVLSDTATLGWTNNSTATNFQVLRLPCGSPLPNETTTGWIDTTDNPYTFSGLNPDTCYTLYVRAVCDGGIIDGGWSAGLNITTQQTPPACGGIFTDSGGANGPYQNNELITTTIPAGSPLDLVTVTFTSFITEGCCDFLSIYDGCDTNAPLIGTFGGANSPGEVTSSIPGGCLTFVFDSDGSVTPDGWVANVTCAPAPTCSKPISLSANDVLSTTATLSWTQPQNPDTTTATAWQVLALTCGSALPTDTTTGWIDAPSNPFTYPGLTPDTCYTFYVRAVCSETDRSPWSAGFNTTTQQIPPACGGTFSDSGGSNGNYQNNELITTTICPDNATQFTIVTFASFVTEGCCDFLSVYDGSNANAPLIGTYGGVNSPGEVISSVPGGCLTFVFDSDGSVTPAGWVANVTCDSCLSPTSVAVTNTGIFDASISWANTGANTSWQVLALPCGSPAPTETTTGWFASDITSYTFTNLDPSTCYDFYVRGICVGNDTSGWTLPVTTTTLPTCPQPINLVNLGTTTDSVTIDWTPVGPGTLFEVVVQAVGGGLPTLPGIITSEHPLTITDLDSGFYEFYIRTICTLTDQSLWSGPVSFFVPEELEACAGVNVQLETSTPGVLNLCPGESCVDMSATFLDTGETTTYNVDTLDFSPPFPFTGGTQTSVNTDDVWSGVIDLPFNFCFFGENQTRALVGSNGVITFDVGGEFGGTQQPEGGCAWAYNQTIPDPTFPIKKAIYGPYQDIDPGIDNTESPFAFPNINYQILGVAPCRVFVVNFSQVAQFSDQCNNDPTVGAQTSQIVLYETSNIIDVYVQRRVPCNSWNGGRAVIGIQNLAGTQAHVPPGRNTGTWSATNEAWRFTPAGASNVDFSWLVDGEPYSTEQAINVCVTETTTVTAQAVYTACGGEQTITTSDVLLQVLNELPVQEDIAQCDSYILPALTLGNYYTQPGGPTGTGVLLNAGDSITTTQTVYVYATVTSSIGSCTLENNFDVTILDEILPTFAPIPNICVNSVAPALAATSINDVTGLWTPNTIDTSTVGTTTYTFTPFGAASCAIPTTLDVTIVEQTVPEFALIPDLCQNAVAPTLSTTSINNIVGTWSPSTINTATVGNQTVVFTPNAGQDCVQSYSQTFNVTNEIIPTFIFATTYCQNDTADALPLVSENGVVGTWNPSSIDTSAFGTFDYVYTPDLTVSPCAVPVTIPVTINQRIVATFAPLTSICQNETLPTLPSTSLEGYAGTWEGTFDASIIGTQTITFVPNVGICAASGTISLTVTTPIVATFNPLSNVCINTSAPTLPTVSSNGFTGTWSGAFDTSILGTQTITFIVDAGQCASDGTLSLTIVDTATQATFNPLSNVCINTSAPTLPITSSNGFTGTWSGTFDTSIAGTQTLTFIVDAGQCGTDGTLSLTIDPLTQATFNPLTNVCLNAAVPTLPTTSSNGFTGTWSGTFDTSILGTQTITFVVDAGQCASNGTLSLTIDPLTVATFTQIAAVCQNSSASALPLTSTNGIVGTWSPNSIDTATVGIATYTFTATSACSTGTTMNIEILPTPVILSSEVDNIERCDTYTLPALTVGNYFSQAGGTGTIAVGTEITSSQTVYVYAQNGICSDEDSFTVTISDSPEFTIKGGCVGANYTLEVIGTNFSLDVADYSWTLGGNSVGEDQTIEVDQPGTYTCVVSVNGCPSSQIFTVASAACIIPKGISPNTDGDNDEFDLTGFNVTQINVFNRQGVKVYSKSNYLNEWHGQSDKGDELPDGTYYYVIDRENAESKTGWVYINRNAN